MPLTSPQKNKIGIVSALVIAVIIGGAGDNAIFKEGKTQAQINKAVDSIISFSLDTLLSQEKMVYTPPITNDLAVIDNDSNVAAKTIIRKRFIDTLGNYVWDTIIRPIHPALKGFSDESGLCDYAIARIMTKDIRYRILLVEADSVVDAIKLKPKRNNWLLSIRPSAFLYFSGAK